MTRELLRPIGYMEVQRSWVGSDNPEMPVLMLNEIYGAVARDQPELKPYGTRTEMTFDGAAGAEHYTLYVGFVPRRETTPPLDPRNLNAAPAPRIGDAPPEMAVQPGWKEQKF